MRSFTQRVPSKWISKRVLLWVSFDYEIEVIYWVVSEFLRLYWVYLHVIQLVHDNCWWLGKIEEHDPLSLTLGRDLDLCCMLIIQLSFLLIRLLSYSDIMVKLSWIFPIMLVLEMWYRLSIRKWNFHGLSCKLWSTDELCYRDTIGLVILLIIIVLWCDSPIFVELWVDCNTLIISYEQYLVSLRIYIFTSECD